MSPVEVATRATEILFRNHRSAPQDWNTDDTVTVGEWKAAIVEAVKEFQQEWQVRLDAQETRWSRRGNEG